MAESIFANVHSPKYDTPLTVKKERVDNEAEESKTQIRKEKFKIFKAKTEREPNVNYAKDKCALPTSVSTSEQQTAQVTPSALPSVPEVEKTKPIDHRSKLGQFGWEAVGSMFLPYILRGDDDKFTAVRMIECTFINKYVNVLPWTVFACTNIKSYYITESEARLLNEINGFHSDFDYGYQTFSTKDVIIHLKDAIKFYKFLESCRIRLQPSYFNPDFDCLCGFVMVNCTATPYIKKGKKKYVLYDMVCTENIKSLVPEAKFKVVEWDLTYFRFLSSVSRINEAYLVKGSSFCSLDDLQTALGVEQFAEWWPDVQYSSENYVKPPVSEAEGSRGKFSNFLSFMQPKSSNNTQVLREKYKESCLNDAIVNPLYEHSQFAKNHWQSSERHRNQTVQNSFDTTQPMQSIRDDDRESIFPSSLERLLSSSNQPASYESQFSQQMQSLISGNVTSSLGSENGLSALATSRPKPFPPPPPLVRVGETSQSSSVSVINHTSNAKSPTSLYPYMQSVVSPSCPPWLSHLLDSHSSSQQPNELGLSHSRMLSGEDLWNLSTSSSNYVGSYANFCRDDRLSNFPRGSPRPAASAGGPPYYPTPPQSSPLQPASILDCPPLPGITDIYGVRATPHGLGDMCSPPPSPETRTMLPNSPRGGFGASSGYPAHITRLAQVDTRYLLAINTEPYKHNSVLVVPVSDVVTKFLRDSSVESCQAVLKSVFGLQLFPCTSLQQEAYAKHNIILEADSQLVSVVDLRNCLCQLRFIMAEREKLKEQDYDMGPVDLALPMPKRWCSNQQGLQ